VRAKGPVRYSLLIFFAVLALTQFLTYQQYLIAKKKEREVLLNELRAVRTRFNDILYSDITAASALALIYEEYGIPRDFDSVAARLTRHSKYVEAALVTKGTIVTNVYPLTEEYRPVIGKNVLFDSLSRDEVLATFRKKGVYFAGPRRLSTGGEGIFAEVPVIVKGELIGFAAVLTKVPTLVEVLDLESSKSGNYSFELVKYTADGDSTIYRLTKNSSSAESEILTEFIPEGDWKLRVSFSETYKSEAVPYQLALIGIVLSLVAGLFAYRLMNQPFVLNRIIAQRTRDLHERMKELSTIYDLSKILQNDSLETGELFKRLVKLVPQGWQHNHICECRFILGGNEYASPGYKPSKLSLTREFRLTDGRRGAIEVVYSDQDSADKTVSFLQEERELLNSIAETLEIYFNKAVHQSALEESEAKFRGAFENAAIGMAIVSLDGKWLSVNRGLSEITGYSRPELLDGTFQQITHPDDLDKDVEFIRKAANGEIDFYRAEKRYIHKKGKVIWINLNVSLIRDKKSTPLYFVSQIENVTERVENQHKFQNLVEKSPVGVYIIKDGKFSYVNPRVAEKTGFSEEELLRMPLNQLFHPEDLSQVYPDLEAKLKGQIAEVRRDVRAFRKNGDPMWLELFGTTTIYEGGVAIIGTLINITEKKLLFDEREKMVQDLIQRNRDLEQFSYIVSHNIRGPLATLLGLGNLLGMQTSETENKKIIKGMRQYSAKLDEVVSDLNVILSIKKELLQSRSDIDLSELVANVVGDLEELITQNRARINHGFNAGTNVSTNKAYLRSIFHNLISNGIKYRTTGSDPEISIWNERHDNTMRIYFKDNGVGFDLKKYGDQVFGLYRRFNTSVEGRGLGLYMVKTQVTALNGTIELESVPGEGSLFVVSLPVHE
jgi:PAS domain S-box-containing protein